MNGLFDKVLAKLPQYGGEYVQFKRGDIYFDMDMTKHTVSDADVLSLLGELENTGAATVSYNNGVFTFVGRDAKGKPQVRLFAEPDIAYALINAGAKQGKGEVPMSNGEDYTFGTIRALHNNSALRHRYDIKFEYDKSMVGMFGKMVSRHPEFGGKFVEYRADMKYHELGSDKISRVNQSDIDNIFIFGGFSKSHGRPYIAYNNGTYSYVGIETDPQIGKPVPRIYLFRDANIANALENAGVESRKEFVPMSSGERFADVGDMLAAESEKPAFKYDKNSVGAFKKLLTIHPEYANQYTEYRAGMQYKKMDGEIVRVSEMDFGRMFIEGLMSNDGQPSVSYNNGVYCYVGMESDPATGKPVRKIYLFNNPKMLTDLHAMGVNSREFAVPTSNGEELILPSGRPLRIGAAQTQLNILDYSSERE